jgi:cytochrome c biogenesis protein CcmG/thiol:disulfide interchange protein DsbE
LHRQAAELAGIAALVYHPSVTAQATKSKAPPLSGALLTVWIVGGLLVAGLAGSFLFLTVPEAVQREHEASFDAACAELAPSGRNKVLGAFPRMAPELQAQDVTGKSVPLSAYRGRVVLVSFWASWCPPCVEEMPSMEALQAKFPDLTIMAISADKSWDAIRAFFSGGSRMTVLWDPSAAAGKPGENAVLARTWGTDKLPESYLVDREGRIRYYIVNIRDWSSPEAERCIQRLLAE